MNKGLKRSTVSVLLIAVAMVVLFSPMSFAASTGPASVYLNYYPGTIEVEKPNPVSLPFFIDGAGWTGLPFELYIYTSGSINQYLGNNFGNINWLSYNDGLEITPLLISVNYPGLVLPAFINLTWPVIADSSTLPEGILYLIVCVDKTIDGKLSPDASCGVSPVNVSPQQCTPTALSISKSSVSRTIKEGENAASEPTITVSDGCSGVYTATETLGATWINYTASGNGTLDISFNTTGLAVGSYSGNIQVKNSTGQLSRDIPVSMTVNSQQSNNCTLTATPSNVSHKATAFLSTVRNASPTTVAIKDSCGTTVTSYTATVTSGASWLSAAPNAAGGLVVTTNATGMRGGTYTGKISVSASGYTSPAYINVTLEVPPTNDCSTILVTSSLSFSGAAGVTTQAQTVSVQNSCGTAQSFTATATKSWINIPSSGTGRLDVTVAMPAAADTGTINVNVAGRTYPVTVSATPTGPCTVSSAVISKTSISQSVIVGSNATSETITVKDNCGNNLAYTAVDDQTWMTAPASGTGSMTVTFAMTSLAKATYTGSIIVTPSIGGVDATAVTIPVTITVQDAAAPGSPTPLTRGKFTYAYIDARSSALFYLTIGSEFTNSALSISYSTTDWVTNMDMIVMYSGATCGSVLPDKKDFDAIKADIAATGHNTEFLGKVFNGKTFYYQISGWNEAVNITPPILGCYYIYMYNNADVRGSLALSY